MSVFVTGAGGFLGRALVQELSAGGRDVLAIMRLPGPLAGARSVACVDLATGAGLADLPWAQCEGVIHLAAAGVKQATRNLAEAVAVNVVGTQLLLNEISRCGRRFPLVVARTYYEDHLPTVPAFRENLYVVTKAAATTLAKAWAGRHPQWTVNAACIFQVYGVGDDPRNVLPYVAAGLRAGQAVQLSAGRAEKDWIHVRDAARAIGAMLRNAEPGWQDWDVGTGNVASVRSMVEELTRVAGAAPALLNFAPEKDRPDVEIKARAVRPFPDWSPSMTKAEGLAELWRSVQ